MPRHRFLVALVVLGTCMLVLLAPRKAYAPFGIADIVHDPLAYIVHLKNEITLQLQYLEQARQTILQAQMIENQLKSLIYEAKNLSVNPLTLLNQITDMWTQYNTLLANAQGMTYSLSQSAAAFDTLYPQLQFTGIGQTVASIGAESTKMLDQIRAASKLATQSQSLYERLCAQQNANALALTSAQQAQGNLQILQASAQIQGLTNEQLASIQLLMAANGRMQEGAIMREVTAEERAAWQAQAWMSTLPVSNFRGPGQGQGPQLPE